MCLKTCTCSRPFLAKMWNLRPFGGLAILVCRCPWWVYSSLQQLHKDNRLPKTIYKNAASYGLLEPWMSEDSWTPTVTALFAIFFTILAVWISFTGLFFVCLISWVQKLILKATEEPRFHPCTVAQHCLSSYNCLQQGMSTTFFTFFAYSQKDFIFTLFFLHIIHEVKVVFCSLNYYNSQGPE